MDGQTNEQIVRNWLERRSHEGLINIIMHTEVMRRHLLQCLVGEEE